MARIEYGPIKILDSVTATGKSSAFPVSDFQHVTIALFCSGTPSYTVKPLVGIKTTVTDNTVDFSSAISANNIYSNVSFSDINDQTALDGSTGLAITSAAKIIDFNVSGVDFAGIDLSAYTSGTITAYLVAYTNE